MNAGGPELFSAAAVVYAISNACIGAAPAAYAADVMPQNLGGFGLGVYRCAGDIGTSFGRVHALLIIHRALGAVVHV